MLIHERLEKIKAILAQNPRCGVEEIQEKLGVSRSTVRRDLLKLEDGGEVLRVHGGALNAGMLRGEPTYDKRSRMAVKAKRLIGEQAAELVEDGQSVFVDAGTSCVEVGRRLLLRENVQIFTNSIGLLQHAHEGVAEIMCIGGKVRRSTEAMVGGLSLNWFKRLKFDVAIIGASSLSVEDGASTTELLEASVKQEAMRRAKRSVLVADASKLEANAVVGFAAWDEFDDWVMDKKLPAEKMKQLKKANIKLHYPK
ncbi:DeoR/GlpR transcriptional regulator [Planctomycetota bacterium]|nr:DeoR/GlpR transcriptional regulator [Planctomycetota bacterium]